MSCYKYWGKLEEIADKLLSYGDLDKYGDSELDNESMEEIIKVFDDVEIIAHDNDLYASVLFPNFGCKNMIWNCQLLTGTKISKNDLANRTVHSKCIPVLYRNLVQPHEL